MIDSKIELYAKFEITVNAASYQELYYVDDYELYKNYYSN